MGRQSGREIRPFKTESGEELLIMQEGLLIPEEVFHLEHVQNRSVFWIYRMSGLFVAFLGFNILQNIFDILGLY